MKIDSPTFLTETTFISASVQFSSGSQKFGNTADDTHQFTGSLAITGSLILNGSEIASVTDADLYQRKCFVKKATSITIPSTASFSAVTASAPAGLTSTSENDFIFFINGQYMEHDALRIFQKNGSTFELHVDTSSIGYSLEADDEIIAQGKFDS